MQLTLSFAFRHWKFCFKCYIEPKKRSHRRSGYSVNAVAVATVITDRLAYENKCRSNLSAADRPAVNLADQSAISTGFETLIASPPSYNRRADFAVKGLT